MEQWDMQHAEQWGPQCVGLKKGLGAAAPDPAKHAAQPGPSPACEHMHGPQAAGGPGHIFLLPIHDGPAPIIVDLGSLQTSKRSTGKNCSAHVLQLSHSNPMESGSQARSYGLSAVQ